MFEFFRSVMLKDKMAHHKFECCATHGDRIFIGTGEGAILVYQVIEKNGAFDTKGLQIERTKLKLPINQIVPVAPLNVLIVVTGGLVFAHSIGDIVEVAQCKGLRDVMQIDVKKEKERILIAVIIKKKVLVYELRDTADMFHKLREYSLPDGVKSVNWMGKNVLIGFKKEYVMLDVSRQDSTPVTLYPTNRQTPIACNIMPMRELELGMDSVGIRINFDGYPTSKKGVAWASLPTCLTYTHPYILSIHDHNSIEVRIPFLNDKETTFSANGGLCQYVTIKYVDRLSLMSAMVDYDIHKPGPKSDTSVLRRDVIVATTSVNSIYLIEMIPIHVQVSQLVSSKNFEAALDICLLCPGEVKEKDVSTVHMYFGLDYFGKKNFLKAMEHFRLGGACPRFVISLFPKFLPQHVEERFRPEIGNKNPIDQRDLSANLEGALEALMAFLLPLRKPPTEQKASCEAPVDEQGMVLASIDTAMLRALVLLKREPTALQFLERPNLCVMKDTEQFLKSSQQWVLLVMLWFSKGNHHQSLELLRNLAERGAPETGLGGDDGATHPSLANTALSALMRNMLEQDKLKEGLMPQQSIQAAALQCAAHGDEESDSALRWQVVGAVTAVAYLKLLNNLQDHVVERGLILEHSAWILAAFEPHYTLTIFTETAHPMAPDEVVLHLEGIEATSSSKLPLAATYLEIMLGDSCNGIDDSNLHNKRIASLIRLVQEERAPKEEKITASQQKLERFLERSQHYEPNVVVQWLQQGEYARSFYRERAIVYRKMKNHAAAINMFLNEVNKMSEAKKYATDVSREEGDAFRLLLQFVLKPDSSGQVRRLEEAVEVINTCEGVDATTALPMLPDETKLSKIADFVKVSLRNGQARRRHEELYHNILRSLEQQLEVAACQARGRCCVIEVDTVCVRCKKKIRDTNFARYPNGILVHQACVDEEHLDPVTGRNYRVSNVNAVFTM